MKPTEQQIKEVAENIADDVYPIHLFSNKIPHDKVKRSCIKAVQWAISLQPEWVAIEPLLTVIENGLTEHINLLNKINEKLKGDNDFWDYQTAAETNEALVELRRLFTTQPPTK